MQMILEIEFQVLVLIAMSIRNLQLKVSTVSTPALIKEVTSTTVTVTS